MKVEIVLHLDENMADLSVVLKWKKQEHKVNFNILDKQKMNPKV